MGRFLAFLLCLMFCFCIFVMICILVSQATEVTYYTHDDVVMLAKLMYRECRGIPSTMEQAAVAWCVLNRVDDPRLPNTIKGVITARKQFAWNPNTPVTDELFDLASDVLFRWSLEKDGYAYDSGRILPKEYVYFTGDGKRNNFTIEWKSNAKRWTWVLPNPYANM